MSLLILTSCAPTLSSATSEGAIRIGGAAFKPITWSEKDTKITVRQIKVHNEVGVQLGLWKRPPIRPKVIKKKPVAVYVPTVKPEPVAVPISPPVLETTPSPVLVPVPKSRWWER
jgi:hypothetical protein